MSGSTPRLSELLRQSGVRPLDDVGADPEIRGTGLDSRSIGPGQLFFAIRGFRADGADFAAEAIRRGASAVVAGSRRPAWADPEIAWVRVAEPRRAAALMSRECWSRPDEALALVGVTGTNGKTTVCHLVQSIARAAGRNAGRIGTVGYSLGHGDRPLPRTTPEAPELYRLLAEMRDQGAEVVVMEVSSHALALDRVAGARFSVAAFLNLTRDHLDFHQDEAAYFEAKARLFDDLGSQQQAILPADSPLGNRLAQRTQAQVITFGRTASAQVRLIEEHCGTEGSSAILETPAGRLPIRTFLLGRFNLENAAAAAACGLALDLPPESISAGVLALDRVPGRMERIEQGQPFVVLVDYAHTPAALANLLAAVRELCRGRVIVVFGCGGERDTGKRSDMGRTAAELADRILVTSDNPRGEDPQGILEQISGGVALVKDGPQRSSTILDRREAIGGAIAEARAGDAVVLAGKGHETTQTTSSAILPFDDRVVASVALRELGWNGGRNAGA